MAHEMSHVIMQHSAKQAGKAQTTGLLAGIAGAVLGGAAGDVAGGMVSQLGQMGIQMTAQGMMLKYSRGDESQALDCGRATYRSVRLVSSAVSSEGRL